MKKTIYVIIIVLSSSFCLPALSQDMASMMMQQMKTEMIDTCSDKAFLSCIGISKKKCISVTTQAIENCEHLFPKDSAAMRDETAFMAHGECINGQLLKNTNIGADKLNACDSVAEDEPSAGTSPMEMEQGIVMFNQAMQLHAKSIGTDGVTLPIYKKATLMSHFTADQMAQMFDVGPLPALVLASPDDTNKIVKFYRNKLKGFKEYNIHGDILFMERGPKKFDYIKEMKIYLTTPHVLITSFQDTPGIPDGTKSKIEISYKK
jgi:hypothetical protein